VISLGPVVLARQPILARWVGDKDLPTLAPATPDIKGDSHALDRLFVLIVSEQYPAETTGAKRRLTAFHALSDAFLERERLIVYCGHQIEGDCKEIEIPRILEVLGDRRHHRADQPTVNELASRQSRATRPGAVSTP